MRRQVCSFLLPIRDVLPELSRGWRQAPSCESGMGKRVSTVCRELGLTGYDAAARHMAATKS